MSKRNVISAIFLSVSAIFLLVYFSLAANLAGYSRFIADDYCSAYDAGRLGVARFVWYWFLTWGGRLSAVSADGLLVLLGQYRIGLVPILALIVWVGVNTAGFWLVLPSDWQRSKRLAAAGFLGLAFVYFLFQTMPNIPQTFFWFSAFRTHSLAVILFNIFLWFYFANRSSANMSIWKICLAFLVGLVNGGFSEAFTFLQILTIGSLVLVEYFLDGMKIHRGKLSFLAAAIVGAVLAFSIMFLSPGTQNRQEFFTAPRTVMGILSISANGFVIFFRSIFKDPFRLLGFLGALGLAVLAGGVLPLAKKIKGWVFAGLASLGLAAIFLSMVPAAYGMGDILPRRAFPVPIFFGFVPLLLACYFAGRSFWADTAEKWREIAIWVVMALLVVSIFGNANTLNKARPAMATYAENIYQLEQTVGQAKSSGEEQLVVPLLGNWAGVYDPSDNPKFWVTVCFSNYYGIPIIGPAIKE